MAGEAASARSKLRPRSHGSQLRPSGLGFPLRYHAALSLIHVSRMRQEAPTGHDVTIRAGQFLLAYSVGEGHAF